MISEDLNIEIWERLLRGQSLRDLGLGERAGYIDLAGLNAPPPDIVSKFKFRHEFGSIELGKTDNLMVFAGTTWTGLDFSSSQLKSLRFVGSKIENCIFDKCQCQDWRLWETEVVGTSFKHANLKQAALGAVRNKRRNRFKNVDFSGADLRGSGFTAAVFDHCLFRDTNLTKVEFGTSAFSDCVFSGELRETMFYHRGFGSEGLPANEMQNVDFRDATFWFVGLRGLNLDSVIFPSDENHIVTTDYRKNLIDLLALLERESDPESKGLKVVLADWLKWAGPQQKRGVFELNGFRELGGETEVRKLKTLLAKIGVVK